MMLNVGNSYIRISEIEVVAPPESAPLKRLMHDAKDTGKCVDLTYGRKTKSIIVLKSGKIVLSYITAPTLANNINKKLVDEKK